ncbi:MAG TPA: patatin-like phospholipase family protein [Ideonella sp.]|uniref:patatin-like phospholipase family protein n=1 Tax=Ideonella sp. TaxID=1929293 RepID=UPI002C0C9348|nr:patatin-like phospholipase family protein [Ideonella sp.]HSI49624.1 patatin-like phospholipase family protein [Ideonella sp.]
MSLPEPVRPLAALGNASPEPAAPAKKSPAKPRASRRKPPPGQTARKIDLALQGGGSHGAFTWGVLDALLEDGRLVPDGISGTSAGAMNAAVLATGYAHGGANGAREALRSFWQAVSGNRGCMGASTLPGSFQWPAWMFNPALWPGYAGAQAFLHLWSPAQLNPLGLDPLRDIVARHVDFPAIQRGPVRVYITATSVRTGQPRIFKGAELGIEALMASACLPQTSRTVLVDGEPYWDGGFAGNPSLWPLIYGTVTSDLLLVQINPLVREGIPGTALEIQDRLNEITFNASLVAEMRAIAFVQRLVDERRVDLGRYKALRLHRVSDEAGLAQFGAASKLNSDPRLLNLLCELGRKAATGWLENHLQDVGKRSSLDPHTAYLDKRNTREPG